MNAVHSRVFLFRNLFSLGWWRRVIAEWRCIPFDRAMAELVDAVADARVLPLLRLSPRERIARAEALKARLAMVTAPLERAWPHDGTERVKRDAALSVVQAIEQLDGITSAEGRLALSCQFIDEEAKRFSMQGHNLAILSVVMAQAQRTLMECWEHPSPDRALHDLDLLHSVSQALTSGASFAEREDVCAEVLRMMELLEIEAGVTGSSVSGAQAA